MHVIMIYLYVKRFKQTFWALILTIHNAFSQPNLHGGHLGFDKNPMFSCGIEMSIIHNRNLRKIWLRKIIISFGPWNKYTPLAHGLLAEGIFDDHFTFFPPFFRLTIF